MDNVELRKVNIAISRGKGDRYIYLYAKVTDAVTGELLVSATADYVTKVAKERGYQIVELEVEE